MRRKEIDNLLDRIPKENRYMVTTQDLINYCYDLEQRINKAIEYIEKFIPVDNNIILMSEKQRDNVLNVLNGKEGD